MKKIIILLVLLVFVISCGNNNSDTSTSTNGSIVTLSNDQSSEVKGPDPNAPHFLIISPKAGQIVGRAEFLLELKNTNYPKFLVFYDETNVSEIGDYFNLDLSDGEHIVEINLIDKTDKILYTDSVTFTVDSSKAPVIEDEHDMIQDEPDTELKAKDLLKKNDEPLIDQKTEPTPVKELSGSEKTGDTSEAESLSLDFEIKLPTPGYNVKGNLVAARIIPSANFTFGNIGETNGSGEGHFHFFINDQKEPIEVGSATYTIKNLDKGTNTLYVEMVRNDHSSYGIKKHVSFEAQTVTGKR